MTSTLKLLSVVKESVVNGQAFLISTPHDTASVSTLVLPAHFATPERLKHNFALVSGLPLLAVEASGCPQHLRGMALCEVQVKQSGPLQAEDLIPFLMTQYKLHPSGVFYKLQKEDLDKFNTLPSLSFSHLLKAYKNEYHVLTQPELSVIDTPYGEFTLAHFEDKSVGKRHYAMIKGELSQITQPLLTRIHSECLTGDVFFSQRCDCGEQLHLALKEIQKKGEGALLYLRQEGRGIGLDNKIKAYKLQEDGLDTVEANEKLGFDADLRDYGIAANMLDHLGIKKVTLMTNNPKKVDSLSSYGIEVTERLSVVVDANQHNKDYLKVKGEKLKHHFPKF